LKPAAFDYYAPSTFDEALALLDSQRDKAVILAGGQSLVPLMNFRLARPATVIDINRLSELSYIRIEGGVMRIGALTRHADLEESDLVSGALPLLREAVKFVGHAQIRNRGTVGGSVSHADPAAELPTVFVALGARFHVASSTQRRAIAADEFFVDAFMTALRPGELLVEIEIPLLPSGSGTSFVEFARRHGDFAIGGACAALSLGNDDSCTRARLVLLAAGPRPTRVQTAESALTGSRLNDDVLDVSAKLAAEAAQPTGDIHGSRAYRLHLLRVMARRALETARDRARAA